MVPCGLERPPKFRPLLSSPMPVFYSPSWPHPLDPKDLITLEELALSSMWDMAALVEVLERKGVLTRQVLTACKSGRVLWRGAARVIIM